MKSGKDYIIFPLDVDSAVTARDWVKCLQGQVGLFKIGLELFLRTGPDLVRWVAERTAGRIFLDLKLHDIPATVGKAMAAVAALQPQLATVHCGESPAMLASAARAAGTVKVLGVTVLTSVAAADLDTAGYRAELVADPGRLVLHKAAMAQAAGLHGVVCSGHEAALIRKRFGSGFITVTPGIRPAWESLTDDQQRVMTPGMAVAAGADYIVVGRPIRNAADPPAAAARIAAEIETALVR